MWSLQQPEPAQVDLDDVAPGRCAGWAGCVLGTAWALRQAGVEVPGFDLVVDSSVPAGGGLPSSAALECATGVALVDLAGADLDPTALALARRRAENEVVGAPTGVMDQMASVHARAGAAVFLDCRSLEVERVPFDPSAAGLSVVVMDTKVAHATSGAEYAARRRECAQAAHLLGVTSLREATEADLARLQRPDVDTVLLRRARHVVTENARVAHAVALLRGGRLAELGRLLDASHDSLRLDYEVSCRELDVAVELAREAGAVGARMTGAGFGGAALALWPREPGELAEVVARGFAERGLAAPEVFGVVPSQGASRIA